MIDEIVWLSGASQDLQAVFSRLEDVRPGSGESLLEVTDRLLSLLRVFPEQGTAYGGAIRRLLVGQKRQYGLFYTVNERRILVIAFIDLRRDPGEIVKLLKERTAG